jgi:hypothetical protein
MVVDGLCNIVIGGYNEYYSNLLVSLSPNGSVNYALSYNHSDYGYTPLIMPTSDNGILAVSAYGQANRSIHKYQFFCHLLC